MRKIPRRERRSGDCGLEDWGSTGGLLALFFVAILERLAKWLLASPPLAASSSSSLSPGGWMSGWMKTHPSTFASRILDGGNELLFSSIQHKNSLEIVCSLEVRAGLHHGP